MTPNVLILVLAAVLLSCRAPLAAAVDEPYVFPPSPAEPYPMERRSQLSWGELADLLASNTTLVDRTGTLCPEELPSPTPLTCGRSLLDTTHRVRCEAAPPLGGYVLDPPQPATASIVFLHGFTDTPFIYSTFFRSALCAAPDLFASVRVAVPLAPVYAGRPAAGMTAANFFAWYDVADFANATMPALVNAPDAAAAEEVWRADAAAVDRLGLFLSTRRVEAVVARERAALWSSGASGGGQVLLVGHSLGAAMAIHVALVSRSRIDGVVPLHGFLQGARTLLASNETYHTGAREYVVKMVAGGADPTVPPPVVKASARILRGLLDGLAEVKYTVLAGVKHSSFFTPGSDVEAVVGVLRRFLEG